MTDQLAVASGAVAPIPRPGARRTTVPGTPATTDLVVEIQNLRQGQVVQVTIRGAWTTDGLEARMASLVAVRQPAELHVRLPLAPGSTVPPALERTRRSLAEVGGVLVVVALTD